MMIASIVTLPKRIGTFLGLLIPIALATHGVASAQATGRMTAGALTFTLTDLNLQDGVTPSLVFKPLPYIPPPILQWSAALLTIHHYDGSEFLNENVTLFGTGTADLSKSYRSSDDVWVSATMSGRGRPETHVMVIDAHASTDGMARRFSSAGFNTGRFEFILSPNTAVEFSVTVRVEASVNQRPKTEEYFMGSSAIEIILGEDHITGKEVYISKSYPARPDLLTGTEASLDVTDTLYAGIENTGNSAAGGFIDFSASAFAWSRSMSNIPEPGSLPMLASGLIVAGFWRWKRAGKAA